MISKLEIFENALVENLQSPFASYWAEAESDANNILEAAKVGTDADAANKAWFLHKVTAMRRLYIQCLEEIGRQKFYEAWCGLEQVEIGLLWLQNNPFFALARFEVEKLQFQVTQWQSLFPYKVFFSPGFLQKRKECSICHKTIDPWSDCEHEVKRVYAGQECYRIITEAEALEISLVLDPVQKYSVARGFLDKDGNLVDQHDYSIVSFVAERLASPFDGWTAKWTRAFHPHTMFPDRTAEGACPCGSGRTYRSCCESQPGIVRPHVQISFAKQPPSHLSNAAFGGYAQRNGPATLVAQNNETSAALPLQIAFRIV